MVSRKMTSLLRTFLQINSTSPTKKIYLNIIAFQYSTWPSIFTLLFIPLSSEVFNVYPYIHLFIHTGAQTTGVTATKHLLHYLFNSSQESGVIMQSEALPEPVDSAHVGNLAPHQQSDESTNRWGKSKSNGECYGSMSTQVIRRKM